MLRTDPVIRPNAVTRRVASVLSAVGGIPIKIFQYNGLWEGSAASEYGAGTGCIRCREVPHSDRVGTIIIGSFLSSCLISVRPIMSLGMTCGAQPV
jgi:hypothetical protein